MSEDFPQPQWGDAFGATLRRCWEAGLAPGASFEIVERDDGVLSVGEAARYFAGPESWSPIERWACDQATGRVLDVGCGAGRHAVPLAREGYDVIGMDASPGAVDIARERGVEAIVGAVENPPPELRGFDTVLLLGNNLGLLASPQEAPTALANLAEVTRRGGRLLATGLDPYRTSDERHLAYHRWNRQRGRLPGQVRMRIRDGAIATRWFDYLFVSFDELRDILVDTPWNLRRVIEDEGDYAVHLDYQP